MTASMDEQVIRGARYVFPPQPIRRYSEQRASRHSRIRVPEPKQLSIEDMEIDSRESERGVTVESRRELLLSVSSVSSLTSGAVPSSAPIHELAPNTTSKLRLILQNSIPQFFPPNPPPNSAATSMKTCGSGSTYYQSQRENFEANVGIYHNIMSVSLVIVFLLFIVIIVMSLLLLSVYIWMVY